ncbi:hypothetical protein CWE13_00305 [Aliidiomarina shirensis]|uniref:Uncharacterized protein n=1 Tax=Aliidiomarina shirensis TaxID=1048642 RepID=A0A432WWH0_9GAMM|nr:hypothetical protein [Aliidiomarina shirensis]RUO38130.1 hypothetical protein CWE13_00305 [Aliidiomarina shirensis]
MSLKPAESNVQGLFKQIQELFNQEDLNEFRVRLLKREVDKLPLVEHQVALKALLALAEGKILEAKVESDKLLSFSSVDPASIQNVCYYLSSEGEYLSSIELSVDAAKRFQMPEIYFLAIENLMDAYRLSEANILLQKVEPMVSGLSDVSKQRFSDFRQKSHALLLMLEEAEVDENSLLEMYDVAASIPAQNKVLTYYSSVMKCHDSKGLFITLGVSQLVAHKVADWNFELADKLMKLESFDSRLIFLFETTEDKVQLSGAEE